MKRRIVPVLAILLVTAGLSPLRAQSDPYINMAAYGVELCSQDMCGAAIFAGALYGQVNNRKNVVGTFVVSVTHGTPLPTEVGQTVPLYGGTFQFTLGRRVVSGVVTGGTLAYSGNNTFLVQADLEITSGGSGTLAFQGVLNHNTFPPTVTGTVESY